MAVVGLVVTRGFLQLVLTFRIIISSSNYRHQHNNNIRNTRRRVHRRAVGGKIRLGAIMEVRGTARAARSPHLAAIGDEARDCLHVGCLHVRVCLWLQSAISHAETRESLCHRS